MRRWGEDPRDVSVILTYYKADISLFAAVQSVLEQSHRRIELLLIDDNEEDERQTNWLSRVITDRRVRFLDNTKRGRINALRFGVENARYPICAIIDDDDIWHQDKLAWDLAYLDRDAGIEFLSWPAQLFTHRVQFPLFTRSPRPKALSVDQMLIKNRIIHSSVTCYRDLLKYDPALTTSEDYELFLRLQFEGTTLYRFDQKRVGQRVHHSNFLASKAFAFFWRSTGIQARYILRWRRYHMLGFPVLRLLYTLIRRHLMVWRADRHESGRPGARTA